MTPAPVTVPPDMPLDEFVAQAWQGRHSTYPVVADGELVGLVGVRDVSRVPPDERPSDAKPTATTERRATTDKPEPAPRPPAETPSPPTGLAALPAPLTSITR